MPAPDFSLPDADGTIHSLRDYRGKWLVVYFYPKDDTPGCTKEACGFRDAMEEYAKNGITVIGISKDSSNSHSSFVKKYSLNFPVLSDPDHKTIEAYGAWGPKKFMGREFLGTKRYSFIISPEGEILKTYEKVDVLTHARQILDDIRSLRKT